ncbi:MAG: 50S ribosomal protein L21 [Oscillospiraceae bacterium]|jgi:large subunit ribosomal protein L21|nr:50S ribosomal protein L21 [Oscillospiraceae bacterium]
MHAIIETGGKQYRVQEGDVLFLEKLPAEEGADVVFDRVLAVFTDDDVKLGAPLLSGAKVSGTVLKHGKDKKILVFKMKAKKTYRRRQGHRQPYTKVEIGKIEA